MQPKIKIILFALIISILLMVIKFGAYFITQSNAILTDAAESIVNVIASAFAFYSIYLAALPKDQNHPYGHGKIEFFSAFVEGSLIILAGIIIIIKSCYNLFYPQIVNDLLQGSILIAITGFVNGIFGWYMVSKSKSLNSITLQADGKHLITDAISSAGLVLGLVLIYLTKILWLDSVLSIFIALYIIYNGYSLTRKSIGGLMDESDVKIIREIIAYLNKNRKDAWIDIHNLRTQKYGSQLHIDCHVTLPYYFDLNKVHQEISEIDKVINQNVNSETEFFIHADPCIPQCCHYCNKKDCPVRQEPKSKDIEWTLQNVTKNNKHFE
ncbi:cation transporter [Pedobacter sp. SD-b]|uniref:Cation transporter n=1 Tax=Pedobacter segetis TaxID=2793069 RepID=A0ABS1BLV6_9SPHI|nr:cation diffusion facilitator family transporter [Pedobacter segetis]MBK0383882.1 cation transporter [Pedobacter segetis]